MQTNEVLALIGAALRQYNVPEINDVDTKVSDEFIVLTIDTGEGYEKWEIGEYGVNRLAD